MEKKLVSLMMSNDLERLHSLIEKMSDEEIAAMVKNSFLHDSQVVAKLITALFRGLGGVSPSALKGSSSTAAGEVSSRRRLTLTSAILKFMAERDIDSKSSVDIIGVLLTEMDAFPAWCLVSLSKEITEYIRNPSIGNFRFLEILPKLVHLLREQDSVPVEMGHMNGPDYKGALINTICSAKWPSNSVVHLTSTFKEIQLSSEELNVVVKKCLKSMNCVQLDEVPPLVYQLLILSAKGSKRAVIEGIVNFFYDKTVARSNLESNDVAAATADSDSADLIEDSSASAVTSSRLQQIESTVVYHVTSSVKQNQELGKEFLKYFKANQLGDYKKMLSSFVVSLALSISKIDVFESQVIELLKKTVTYFYKDEKRKEDSKWLRENSPRGSFDMTRCVLDSVEKNKQGWDIIMEGLVSFAFSLMEVSSAKNNFGKPVLVVPLSTRPAPSQSLNILGGKILEFCSKVHRNVAMDIVSQLINRIVTKGTGPVSSHFIDLLTKLLKSSPHSHLEKSQDFRNIFDYFAFLPLETSRSLLAAILPVARISPSLKNSLVLVLRKSLFSRQIEMRKVAVVGFLLLLKNFRVLSGFYSSQSQPSASQVDVDVHRTYRPNQSEADNKSLCLEILGTLRRCLGQQSEVRSLLYEGLFEVVAANPFLTGPVVEVLFNQLNTYFDPEEGNACPLKFTSSMSLNFDLWVVSEPLPDLISNLVFCIAFIKSGSTNDTEECQGMVEKADVILDSMATRIVKCDVEDFEMDKSVEFDTSTNAGSRNSSLANLTSGICEVLIMREVICFEPDQQHIERVLQLFQCLCRITDAAQEGQPNRKVRVKKVTSDLHKSGTLSCRYLSLNFLVRVIKMMFDSDHMDVTTLLLNNNDFVNYIFNSAATLFQNLPTTSTLGEGMEFRCRGYPAKDRERFVEDCFDLGRLLLKRYLRIALRSKIATTQSSTSATGDLNCGGRNNDQQQEERPGSAKQLNAFCLKVFHQVLLLVAKQLPERLEEFLDNLDITTKTNKRIVDKEKVGKLNTYIKIFQRIFFTLLTSGDDSASSRDRLTSMQCVVILLDCCHGDKREEVLAESYNWLLRLFKERTIDDLELLKLVTKQILVLMKCTDSSLTFLKEVTRDVHLCIGDVNQEVELDQSNKHASVTVRTSAPIIQLVLSHLEQEVEDSEWLICRMRCQLGVASSSLSVTEGIGEDDDDLEDGNSRDDSSADARNQVSHTHMLSIKDVNKSLIGRLSCMTDVFNELVQTSIPLGPITEHLLKVLNRFYCLLSTVVKLYIWKFNNKSKEVEVHVSGRFEKFIKHTATQLTRVIYPMITYIENTENERLQAASEKQGKKKKKKTDGAAEGRAEKIKRMKETRFTPTLILSVEQYEKLLIQLSKKSKIDLMIHFKLSTARDFRINTATLQAALDQQQQNEDDDEDDENNDDDDDGASVHSLIGGGGDGEPSRNKEDDDEDDDGGEPSTSSRAPPPKKRSRLSEILPNKSSARKRSNK